MYCRKCGNEIEASAAFCSHCGEKIVAREINKSQILCPYCGSGNVDVNIHKEEGNSRSVTKTKSKYKEKGHGCIWWLTIGWWGWIVDLFMWIFAFPIRFLIQLFKKKKYKGKATSVTTTMHETVYKSVFLCKNCGHHWEK